MKIWFSLKCQTRKYLFQELKYFFSIGVSHTVALISLLLLKFENVSEKVINKKAYHLSTKQHFFPDKTKNLRPFRTGVLIRFHALSTLGASAAIKNHENSEKHWYWYQIGQTKLFVDINIQLKQSTINSNVHSQFR